MQELSNRKSAEEKTAKQKPQISFFVGVCRMCKSVDMAAEPI